MAHPVSANLIEEVNPKHTALVLHDMQNDFCTPNGKIYRKAAKHPETIAAVVDELAKLVKVARARGVKVVYFQQMHLPNAADIPAAHVHHLISNGLATSADDVPCIRGSWGHQIIDALKPRAGRHRRRQGLLQRPLWIDCGQGVARPGDRDRAPYRRVDPCRGPRHGVWPARLRLSLLRPARVRDAAMCPSCTNAP